jgi:hypothetical protein
MMARAFLLALALLWAQHGALLHGLEHAAHDLDVAAQGEDDAPPLGHGVEECVAYDAIGHALGSAPLAVLDSDVQPALHVAVKPFFLPAARIVFDSRAPPFSA